ncbi:hypothetical protein DRQ20_04730 [bacterium]|nr:MAG: hypothetical protein DRQ20_04730 [bacterium]
MDILKTQSRNKESLRLKKLKTDKSYLDCVNLYSIFVEGSGDCSLFSLRCWGKAFVDVAPGFMGPGSVFILFKRLKKDLRKIATLKFSLRML